MARGGVCPFAYSDFSFLSDEKRRVGRWGCIRIQTAGNCGCAVRNALKMKTDPISSTAAVSTAFGDAACQHSFLARRVCSACARTAFAKKNGAGPRTLHSGRKYLRVNRCALLPGKKPSLFLFPKYLQQEQTGLLFFSCLFPCYSC